MDTINVDIKLPKDMAAQEKADLPAGAFQEQYEEMSGQQRGTQLGADPLVVIAVAVPIAWLLERIVDHYLPKQKVLVLWDLSGKESTLEVVILPDNSDTKVIVQTPEGKVKVEDGPRSSMLDSLMSCFKLWKNTNE